MRRAMAAEAAAARARGETIDEKTTSEEEDEDEEDDEHEEPVIVTQKNASRDANRPLRDPFLNAYDSDRGNDADMDDTSMSSRASGSAAATRRCAPTRWRRSSGSERTKTAGVSSSPMPTTSPWCALLPCGSTRGVG